MQARFMIERPDEIEATLKITMKVKDWEILREQLVGKWPSSDLSSTITDLLSQARKRIYPTPQET
jgi:hypothetical protein